MLCRVVCVIVFAIRPGRVFRGRAGHAIILYVFFHDVFVKIVFLQQLYCPQYYRAVSTMRYGKRRISPTKPAIPLQSILKESLH